ncbi:NB-ARC domains-containing protein, partial [Tanacetum coccineum]
GVTVTGMYSSGVKGLAGKDLTGFNLELGERFWEMASVAHQEEDDVSSGSQLSHMLPSSLTRLALWNFGKLESVSMGLQHLTSLQHLEIMNCPKIQDLPETLLPSLLTLSIWQCTDNLKEKTRMGFESSVNFNNQIYMPSSVPLSIISEKAYTFVSVNMNLPGNFFDAAVIGLRI